MLLCCTERLLNSNTNIQVMVRKISNLPNSNSSLLDYWHLFYCGQESSIEFPMIEFENENNKKYCKKREKEQDLNYS